jgi:hypothetical protein
MPALILTVLLGVAVAHWLLSPLTAALSPLAQMQPVPLVLAGLLLWLLAGQARPRP